MKNEVATRLDNIKTINSLEIAEMLDKEHSELLKEIEGRKDGKNVGIIPILEKGKFHVLNYFIPSTYKAGKREYKCYEVTKMGCELLGNKQQGEKGILFTAKYVERFNQMEEVFNDPYAKFSPEVKAIFALDIKTQEIAEKVNKLEMDMPLFNVDCKEISAAVKKKGIETLGGYKSPAYCENSLRAKIYSDIYSQIKRQFGISRYEALKRSQISKALEIVSNYKAPYVLEDEIICLNNQLKINHLGGEF